MESSKRSNEQFTESFTTIQTKLEELSNSISYINGKLSIPNKQTGANANQEINNEINYELFTLDSSENTPLGIPALSQIDAAPDHTVEINSPDLSATVTNKSGSNLSLGELEGMPLCINYKDGGYDVWFYGSLNENGNWNGLCVLNCYKDEKLTFLFESEFINGIRIGNYKSLANEDAQYILNDRSYYESYSIGRTYTYQNTEMPENKFKTEKPVRYSDCTNGELIKEYSGRTSNGLYNDKTGTAFHISYNDDETVRTFYQGHFVDGSFVDDRPYDGTNDPASNVFWISLAHDENGAAMWYRYYIGPFVDGQPDPKGEKRDVQLSHDENPSDKLPPEQSGYPPLKWKSW